MRLIYSDFDASDLRGPTVADVYVAVDATFRIEDTGTVIFEEPYFPVVELAHWLQLWVAGGENDEFMLESMSAEDPGLLFVSRRPAGWVFGSVFAPGVVSSPQSWPEVETCVASFVATVRQDLVRVNLDPEWVFA